MFDRLTGGCKTIKASALSSSVLNSFTVVPNATRATNKGYNASCGCYYWGYRPEVTQLLGLGAAAYGIGDYQLCVDVAQNCPAVPPPKCPACPVCAPGKPCPACPKCEPQKACKECPDCPDCPQLAPPGQVQPPVATGGAYGPVLGFLLAALVVGGGGFYAYKHFGKKKR